MNHTTYGHKGTEKIGSDLRTRKDSGIASEQIRLKTAEFLARGQKVQHIASGISGVPINPGSKPMRTI